MVKITYLYTSGGNVAANQSVINVGDDKYFQSYDTVIAAEENGIISLDENYWNYSGTTSKYLYQFLRDYCGVKVYSKRDLVKLIKDKKVNLKNLNED